MVCSIIWHLYFPETDYKGPDIKIVKSTKQKLLSLTQLTCSIKHHILTCISPFIFKNHHFPMGHICLLSIQRKSLFCLGQIIVFLLPWSILFDSNSLSPVFFSYSLPFTPLGKLNLFVLKTYSECPQ